MKERLVGAWEYLSATLWFLPSLFTVCAAGLALGLVWLDQRIEPETVGFAGLVFGGGPEGARGVLSAISSSIITVAGVTFSITVLTLSLASQQFTPRVLRQFTADRGNQVVLGVFLGTFIYCLLVLRTIRADSFGEFIPHFAVTGAVLLAVASLVVLIYFIHHVSVAIQVDTVLQQVAGETHAAIRRLFPEPLGEPVIVEEGNLPNEEARETGGKPILVAQDGYLQNVDEDRLMHLATRYDVVVRMESRIGEYVFRNAPIAVVWPRKQLAGNCLHDIQCCFTLGRNRTVHQDPEFGVVQIVDIALKALSPGINDPTTAVNCLDYLTGLLRDLGTRNIPSPYRRDNSGQLRIIARGTDFSRIVELAFRQIRHYGAGDVVVCLAVLNSIEHIAAVVREPSQQDILRLQLESSKADFLRLQNPTDRAAVLAKAATLQAALKQSPDAGKVVENPHSTPAT